MHTFKINIRICQPSKVMLTNPDVSINRMHQMYNIYRYDVDFDWCAAFLNCLFSICTTNSFPTTYFRVIVVEKDIIAKTDRNLIPLLKFISKTMLLCHFFGTPDPITPFQLQWRVLFFSFSFLYFFLWMLLFSKITFLENTFAVCKVV